MSFADHFLEQCKLVLDRLDRAAIDEAAGELARVRERGGRVFAVGSGGGAGYASHAVCDLRKLCCVEAYAPYDNVSELTARTNDDGWDTTLSQWLTVSRLNGNDALLLFSVGGGSPEPAVSVNLVNACLAARACQSRIIAIVGRDGGFAGKVADLTIIVPPLCQELVTPLTEGIQAVIWHLLVSHPLLKQKDPKWEQAGDPAYPRPAAQ